MTEGTLEHREFLWDWLCGDHLGVFILYILVMIILAKVESLHGRICYACVLAILRSTYILYQSW